MFKFIYNGIIRDINRSLLPIIVVTLGVFFTIFLSGWIQGVLFDMIEINANFTNGHVKVMTQAYAENESQIPNDLAIIGVEELMDSIEKDYPEMEWVSRIQFGGLLDVPDKNGETRAQGAAVAKAIDFSNEKEIERLNIRKALVKDNNSRLPKKSGEILISDDFAKRFHVNIRDEVSIIGSTMYGSMMFSNYIVCGTLRFGNQLLDKGAAIVDIADARRYLEMEDASSEIFGYFKEGEYNNENALKIKNTFTHKYTKDDDEYSPTMKTLTDDQNLGVYLSMTENMSAIMVSVLIFILSIVLWNTGLIGTMRRYSEFGVRLALGEQKKDIYKTLIYEAIIIGLIGSITGTVLGLIGVYVLQENGLDISGMMKNITMMMPTVFKAKLTPNLFYIGFIPGLLAMILGNALAGRAIFKRNTAKLFKELEV
ncbi:MAG: FtsX-like permease family protein [Bacteroidales bacterium]|nr:FtsX-like permease family protein [Bacteroidales bacterium]MDD3691802.1 FtsX-like permease family protein [Bacteroidales bacterium]MDD4044760.1 FtsX-like permease family protein [Bacteroidales bacterium]MDX9889794.1 FtsX-like permease family protein [Bacteroidales bacterium]